MALYDDMGRYAGAMRNFRGGEGGHPGYVPPAAALTVNPNDTTPPTTYPGDGTGGGVGGGVGPGQGGTNQLPPGGGGGGATGLPAGSMAGNRPGGGYGGAPAGGQGGGQGGGGQTPNTKHPTNSGAAGGELYGGYTADQLTKDPSLVNKLGARARARWNSRQPGGTPTPTPTGGPPPPTGGPPTPGPAVTPPTAPGTDGQNSPDGMWQWYSGQWWPTAANHGTVTDPAPTGGTPPPAGGGTQPPAGGTPPPPPPKLNTQLGRKEDLEAEAQRRGISLTQLVAERQRSLRRSARGSA